MGSGPNDAWIAGSAGVRHFKGATWTSVPGLSSPIAIWLSRQPPPVQTLIFDEDPVEGARRRPDGLRGEGAPAVEHASLIELRRQFVPELLNTLEDL